MLLRQELLAGLFPIRSPHAPALERQVHHDLAQHPAQPEDMGLRQAQRLKAFPVDDVTLAMLEAACTIGPGETQTHLQDFLRFGEIRVGEVIDVDTGEKADEGSHIVQVFHEPGTEPHSEHQVILALIAEIRRLRATD